MTHSVIQKTLATWEELMGAPLTYTAPESLPPDSAWRVALEYEGEPLGWLSVDRPPGDFTETELVGWLNLCAHLLSSALGESSISAGLAEEVLAAWNQQSFLNEILKVNSFGATFDTVAEKLSRLACGIFRCDNAFLAFRESLPIHYRSAKPLSIETVENAFELLANSAVVTLNDATPTFLGTRVPLTTSGEAVLVMLGAEGGLFRARERQLADSLTEQIGTVLDNIALQHQLSASLRLQHEIEIAAEIQASLMPQKLPQPEGFELAGIVSPASQVGGDFYDVIRLDANALGVMMGDVAGKGIPAAMLTTLIRSELRGQMLAGNSPAETVTRASFALEPDLNRLDTFATALVARFDPEKGAVWFASAGHTDVCHWQARTQTARQFHSTTLPLGLFPRRSSVEHALCLETGDLLVFYSDGLTEALNPNNEIFGWEGLEEVLRFIHMAPAPIILNTLLQAINAHQVGRPVSDDITLLVIRRQPQTPMPEAEFSFVLPRELSYLKTLDATLQAAMNHLPVSGLSEDWRHEFSLAVVEHVSNLVRHAYANQSTGKVYGRLTRTAEQLTLDTMDSGVEFDMSKMPQLPRRELNLNDLPEGGFGLPLIRAVMNDINYTRRNGYNHWRLSRRWPGD